MLGKSSTGDGGASNRYRWRVSGVVILALSVLAIASGLAIGGHIAWFDHRVSSRGHALVSQERAAVRAAAAQPATACDIPWPSASGPQGLVEAPSIGLTAPVLAGTGNAQLDVAVGHLSTSAWPGQPGTSLLAAHDVSYFSRINALADGSAITFVTPCHTYVYKVIGRQIVKAGSPVYNSSESRLVLETCYPLNALFFTSHRYLVTAELSGVIPTGKPLQPAPPPPNPPRVPAPPALAAQGLDLSTNDVQLATLQFGGHPGLAWQQSAEPVADERSVIEAYDGAVRSAEQGEAAWWHHLAPRVAFSRTWPLRYGRITQYTKALTPTLLVQGERLTGAVVDAGIRVSSGRYLLRATMAVERNTLVITQWQLTPVG